MPERLLAVVTGASAGNGASVSRKLAARGYDLLLVARRGDRLKSLAGELAQTYKVNAEGLAANLIDDADLGRVADRISGSSNLGLLVNNAGFGTEGFFFEAPLEG